jgi:predicted nucleic acid-binding protein
MTTGGVDAEVLQEILHRFLATERPDAIQPAFNVLLSIADEILPIDLAVVERAKQIALAYRGLSARDAIHAAVMQHHGIAEILSFDKGFDDLPAIRRIH